MGTALAAMLVGGVVSRVAMTMARRRLRDQTLVARLQAQDPNADTIWTLTHEGAAARPFRIAFAAYRIGTAARVAFYGLGALVAVGVLGAGLAYGRQRGLAGLQAVDWRLTAGGPLVVAYLFALLGTRAARALTVWRRSRYFPEGLAYAHLVSQRVRTDWRKVPSPSTDAVADFYERWSCRLERAAIRLVAPAGGVGLLAGIAYLINRT
jgi:hypothetical protein